MADYKSKCRPGRFLFAAHFGTSRNNVGFGTYLHHQANYYVILDEENHKHRYQFQIVIYNWIYEPLGTYFADFASDTSCPLFRNINSTEFEALRKNEPFVLTYKNGSLAMSIDGPVLALHLAKTYWERFRELEKFYNHVGVDYFFPKKSAFMRSLWQPKTTLKKLMLTLWRNILDKKQRFFGVHIRRGAKISGPYAEVKEVPVGNFSLKLQEICRRLGPECPKNVYLMHDEEWVFPAVQTMLKDSFKVYNFWTLLNRSNVFWDENMISGAAHDPGSSLVRAPHPSGWAWRTKQVILEITLLAMSDELICTYSSNICKIAALLRGNHTSRIYSMDFPIWDPY